MGVDTSITVDNYEEYLDKMMEKCAERPAPTAREMVAAAVFKQAFIPHKLADIDHFERDLARASGTQPLTTTDHNSVA